MYRDPIQSMNWLDVPLALQSDRYYEDLRASADSASDLFEKDLPTMWLEDLLVLTLPGR